MKVAPSLTTMPKMWSLLVSSEIGGDHTIQREKPNWIVHLMFGKTFIELLTRASRLVMVLAHVLSNTRNYLNQS